MGFRHSGHVFWWLVWNHLYRQVRWKAFLHVPHFLSGIFLSVEMME
jgi:hypothetical protein